MVVDQSAPLWSEVDMFLAHCTEANLSLSTIYTYNQMLGRFARWMQQSHPEVTSVQHLRPLHLTRFRHYLRVSSAASGKEMGLRTQGKYMAAIRSLLRYYATQTSVPVMSRDQVRIPRVPSATPLTPPPGENDIQLLLQQPDASKLWGLRDRAIIAALVSSGLRVTELCSLNRRDVREDLLGKAPMLEVSLVKPTRGRRSVSLDAATQHHLTEYLSARTDRFPPLFIRHKPGKSVALEDPQHRLTRQMVNKMLEKYAKAAGLAVLPSADALRRVRLGGSPEAERK